jgi:hypothetical protein
VITVLVAVTVAGLVTGRLLRPMFLRIKGSGAPPPPPGAEGNVEGLGRKPGPLSDERLRGLPCTLGDVVLLADGAEAWLAGAVLFRERAADRDESGDVTRTVAALFVAPESGRERAVYARAAPGESLDWMWPLSPDALTVGAEPPSAVEHDGDRFERVRRMPFGLERVGDDAPELGATGVVGEYEGGAGARLVIVIGATSTRAWKGHRLGPGLFEILPGKRED